MPMQVNGLILAAGMSTRMGSFKPLLPFDGKTLIESSIDSMLLSGVSQVVVVTGYRADELETIIQSRYIGNAVICKKNPDFAVTDMLTSIKIGLRAMPDCGAFFLLPGDMPTIQKETYLAIFRAMPKDGHSIVFPSLGGHRNHPPLISNEFKKDILDFDGSGGLRELWKYHEKSILTVPVDDMGCWTDLDTYEQYIRCIKNSQAAVKKT